MVVCKYFQQGTCRYGQYCRFQHVNNFGTNQGNGNKQFAEGKSIVLVVAEEVLSAERGGQWLLSCFGPFKEQSCIPGMEDVSPEEVRWEMYQAQKNGTVDQTKLQFQQLCQAMTAKREALKNPTPETAAMLEKLQKTNRDGAFGAKTNFALSNAQLAQTANASTASGVFGPKPFGTAANPFGGGFNASGQASASIFGRTTTGNASVFGGKPTFGGGTVFGTPTSANNVFGANQSGMQSFAAAGSSVNSVFGANTGQTVFSQPTTFGTTSQASPFSIVQAPTSSVFGATTTATSSSVFGSPASTLFGGASATSTTGLFGANNSSVAPGNSMFGSSTGNPSSSTKNTVAFGGAPVFGTTGSFGNNQTSGGFAAFGAQPNFENSTIATSNVFGGTSSAQSSTFGSNSQTTASFGALATSPFGNVASTVTTASSAPFGATSDPFGTAAAVSPFARNTNFGNTMQSENFGAAIVSAGESPFASSAPGGTFGAVPAPNSAPFGAPIFGNSPSTPFASTTSTATISNPFAPRIQQNINNSPFGIAQTTISSCGTQGRNSGFGSITTALIIDETAYTPEGKLTDDEKFMYLADQFVLGNIPVKPPTIELR